MLKKKKKSQFVGQSFRLCTNNQAWQRQLCLSVAGDTNQGTGAYQRKAQELKRSRGPLHHPLGPMKQMGASWVRPEGPDER